jgi:hypothetical protein
VAAIAGTPADSRHSAVAAAAATLKPLFAFMPDMLKELVLPLFTGCLFGILFSDLLTSQSCQVLAPRELSMPWQPPGRVLLILASAAASRLLGALRVRPGSQHYAIP